MEAIDSSIDPLLRFRQEHIVSQCCGNRCRIASNERILFGYVEESTMIDYSFIIDLSENHELLELCLLAPLFLLSPMLLSLYASWFDYVNFS
ncbi:unnamed protein product [Cochlearia groenlandica]